MIDPKKTYGGKKTCRYCDREIAWITTAKNRKLIPVEYPGTMRHGSDPLPEGKYFDEFGNFYRSYEVPLKIEVYRSHFGNCSGRKE